MEEPVSLGASIGVSHHVQRPAIATTYAIAGRFICVQTADAELANLFRHYFSAWYVRSIPTNEQVDPHATIVVKTTASPEPPEHLVPFEVAEGGMCRSDASSYFFEHHGSVVRARNSPYVEVWVGENEAARDRRMLARLVFNATMSAVRRAGLFDIHSAGVVSPAGAGFLIIGPSGSGKSSLATKLAAAGWQYLSDDALLLCDTGNLVEARALRRVFALSDDSFATTTGLDLSLLNTYIEAFDPFKKRFDPRAIFPHQFADSCIPTTLLFSRVTSEKKSRARALMSAETMGQLLRMCPWACYDKSVAEPHLRVLGNLARQAKGVELLAGEDLLLNAGYASRFLLEELG